MLTTTCLSYNLPGAAQILQRLLVILERLLPVLLMHKKKALRYDPDVLNDTSTKRVYAVQARLSRTDADKVNFEQLGSARILNHQSSSATDLADFQLSNASLVRRLTERGYRDVNGVLQSVNSSDTTAQDYITFHGVTDHS